MKIVKKPAVDISAGSSQKIKELESRAAELEESWKRSLADYANLEKRIESQRQIYATLASVSIISKMIEVLDDLLLAHTHLEDQGLQMTINKFLSVLKSEGLEEINVKVGDQFDPLTMECVEAASGEKDMVMTVKRKGYSLNSQCLRPAQVVVGRGDTAIPASSPSGTAVS
ncbi:MAG: nucleotide exchange factor GrpE [Candidatus Shapirobacteria bacterium]|jgi:molecular chaperone GrpE